MSNFFRWTLLEIFRCWLSIIKQSTVLVINTTDLLGCALVLAFCNRWVNSARSLPVWRFFWQTFIWTSSFQALNILIDKPFTWLGGPQGCIGVFVGRVFHLIPEFFDFFFFLTTIHSPCSLRTQNPFLPFHSHDLQYRPQWRYSHRQGLYSLSVKQVPEGIFFYDVVCEEEMNLAINWYNRELYQLVIKSPDFFIEAL